MSNDQKRTNPSTTVEGIDYMPRYEMERYEGIIAPGEQIIIEYGRLAKKQKMCSEWAFWLRRGVLPGICDIPDPNTIDPKWEPFFTPLADKYMPEIQKAINHAQHRSCKKHMNFDINAFRIRQLHMRPRDVMSKFFAALKQPRGIGPLPMYDAPLLGIHISVWGNGANTVVFSWD